jgi:hypothetical protein
MRKLVFAALVGAPSAERDPGVPSALATVS